MEDNEKLTGEVDNIRNILFGDQAKQIDGRFEEHAKSMASLRNEINSLRQALEIEASTRGEADQYLMGRVDVERKDRETANQQLQEQIDLEHSGRVDMIEALRKEVEQGFELNRQSMVKLKESILAEFSWLSSQFAGQISNLSEDQAGMIESIQSVLGVFQNSMSTQQKSLETFQESLAEYQDALDQLAKPEHGDDAS
jgi:hypothetical protein